MSRYTNNALPSHQIISIATLFFLAVSFSLTCYAITQTNWKHELISFKTKIFGLFIHFFSVFR